MTMDTHIGGQRVRVDFVVVGALKVQSLIGLDFLKNMIVQLTSLEE